MQSRYGQMHHNPRMRIMLFGLVFSVPLISTAFIPSEYAILTLAIGIPLYALGTYLDVRSTISFGLERVIKYETSPLFSRLCKMGFGKAISSQVLFEGVSAVLLIPFVISFGFDIMLTGMCLISFGCIHFIGYMKNRAALRADELNRLI